METAIAFPYLVLALAVIAVTGHGFWALVGVLGLVSWVSFARVVLAETQAIKRREYVLVARLMGLSTAHILRTYVLRGLRRTLLVVSAFVFADLLVAEASLSFLGLGAPLGTPSWGSMLAESRIYAFTAPWTLYAPAAAVVLAVVTANLVGDGLSRLWGGGARLE
jgi:peptide/nickel transport system permease protein